MNFKRTVDLIKSDLYRRGGKLGTFHFLWCMMFIPGFKYSTWLRVCTYLRQHSLFKYFLFPVATIIVWHYPDKYGIDISSSTTIGTGLFIGHFGGIIVHPNTIIGNDFVIAQGVTIGEGYNPERTGTPTIGDNVFIGPGAKVFGKIKIGSNVQVGANCVVTKDIPDNAVVVGVPGRIIKYR